MATLDQIPATEDAVHLLLVGDSKAGKSTYMAQAAIDGFTLVYKDSDNGLSALRYALKDHPEAMKRIHYFGMTRPEQYMRYFLKSNEKMPFRWVPRLNMPWAKLLPNLTPDDEVWEFDSTKIPKSWVLVGDSWTSTAADALGIGDATQAAKLLEGTNQSIYGEANSNLTYICNMLQKIPCHVAIQAHATKYEVYDKPIGVEAGKVKQAEMVLRETLDVPLSSSKGHGQTMASRFNHIGWLGVNVLGETEIDFTRKPRRVGGGPPNRMAKAKDLPFSKLVGKVPEAESGDGWYVQRTHGELIAK